MPDIFDELASETKRDVFDELASETTVATAPRPPAPEWPLQEDIAPMVPAPSPEPIPQEVLTGLSPWERMRMFAETPTGKVARNFLAPIPQMILAPKQPKEEQSTGQPQVSPEDIAMKFLEFTTPAKAFPGATEFLANAPTTPLGALSKAAEAAGLPKELSIPGAIETGVKKAAFGFPLPLVPLAPAAAPAEVATDAALALAQLNNLKIGGVVSKGALAAFGVDWLSNQPQIYGEFKRALDEGDISTATSILGQELAMAAGIGGGALHAIRAKTPVETAIDAAGKVLPRAAEAAREIPQPPEFPSLATEAEVRAEIPQKKTRVSVSEYLRGEVVDFVNWYLNTPEGKNASMADIENAVVKSVDIGRPFVSKILEELAVEGKIQAPKQTAAATQKGLSDAEAVRSYQGQPAEAGQTIEGGEANRRSNVEQAAPVQPEPVVAREEVQAPNAPEGFQRVLLEAEKPTLQPEVTPTVEPPVEGPSVKTPVEPAAQGEQGKPQVPISQPKPEAPKAQAEVGGGGKWQKVASVTPGGKPYFWIKDTPNGRRWVTWNRSTGKWDVHGEQAAPEGKAPVFGTFKNATEAKKFVDSGKAVQEPQPTPTPAPEAAKPAEQGPEMVGMGGARPSEYVPSSVSPTSTKNAVVDSERAARGEPPMMAPLKRTWGEAWDEAMAEIDNNPAAADQLISELLENPRALSDKENAIVLQRRADLKNEFAKAQRDASQAYEESVEFPERSEAYRAAQVRRQFWSDKLLEWERAVGKGGAGTETGRALAARKMMMADDFTLASLETQKRMDVGDRQLTRKEVAELKKIADNYKATSDALEVKLAEAQRKTEEIEAQRILERAQAEAKQAELAPKISPRILDYAERFVSRMEQTADRYSNELFGSTWSPTPDTLYKAAYVGAARMARIGIEVAKWTDVELRQWTDSMVKSIGEKFLPYADQIKAMASKILDQEITNAEAKPQAPKIKRAVYAKGDKVEFSKGIAQRISEKRAEKKPFDIGYYARRYAAFLVENGLRDREKLIDEVHAVLGSQIPDWTRRQTMDALSGYGKYKPLDKNGIKPILRDLYGQMQQIGKLEDMQAGKAPAKTGPERRTPTDEERRLIKQVEEAKRRGGYEVTDPERQLRTALQAIQTRLENQIKDLEFQIANRTKIVKEKHPVKLDEQTEALKLHRDELKAQYDEIFNGPLTPEERLARWKQRTQSKIAEYTAKVQEKDFAPKPKPDPIRFDNEALHLRFELNQIHKAWLEGRVKDQLAQQNALQKGLRLTGEGLNTVRALLTSFDLSAVLRQGGFIAFGHPVRSARSVPAMLSAWKSPKGQFKVMEKIRTRPNAPMYDRSGLYLAEHGTQLTRMEEVYMSRWAEKIPGVAASARAYTTFLNKLRADSFDAMAQALSPDGNVTLPEAKVISNFINEATGRGSAGLNKAAVALNTIFFAPRYVASRFQLLAGHPIWTGAAPFKGTARARALVASEYGRFLAGAAVVYGLAAMAGGQIETDPRSSDFLKIKIGDTRIDPLFGLIQASVLVSRLTTGETKTLRGRIQPIRGKRVPYGKSNAWDVIARFGRAKFSPVVGTSVDIATGKDVVGQPIELARMPGRLLVPISLQDTYQAMIAQGIPAGTALGILSMLGVGLQTFDNKGYRPVISR